MDSAKWHEWLQIAGLFGVVGSLIFVGLQMKQTHEIARSEIFQARAAASAEMVASIAANKEAQAAYIKSASGNADTITPIEASAGSYAHFGVMFLWDNAHFQYANGFISEEAWGRVRRLIKHRMRNPFQREFMIRQVESNLMRPAFRDVIAEIITELSLEDAAATTDN